MFFRVFFSYGNAHSNICFAYFRKFQHLIREFEVKLKRDFLSNLFYHLSVHMCPLFMAFRQRNQFYYIDFFDILFLIQKRTSWMLPGLILSVCGITMLLLNLLFIPILGTFHREQLLSYINELLEYYGDARMDDSMLSALLITAWIIVAISTGFEFDHSLRYTIARQTNLLCFF